MNFNLAIVGTGNIADHCLAPAINGVRGANLWSVMSRDRSRALQFAQKHGAKSPDPAHVHLERLVEDQNLNAVIIATPDKLHARQAITCAKAGKHVLVEKPMATEKKDAQAMVEACQAAGVHLAVAYHLRWHDGHRRLAENIKKDKLGNLRQMLIHWTWRAPDASNWRASPQVGRWWSLAGVGTHCLDLIRWIMVPSCGEIVTIKSMLTSAFWEGPHDESALVSMKFESGATAGFYSSVLFDSPSRVEIYGDRGQAICDDTLGRHGSGKIHLNNEPLAFHVKNPYAGEIMDFVKAIEENRSPEVNGREGLRNVELLVEMSANS